MNDGAALCNIMILWMYFYGFFKIGGRCVEVSATCDENQNI